MSFISNLKFVFETLLLLLLLETVPFKVLVKLKQKRKLFLYCEEEKISNFL